MCSNKEQLLIKQIIAFLQSEEIKTGERLPSERDMALRFNSSRNTIRSTIKMLQASEIIKVKPGSGYFLISKNKFGELIREDKESDQIKRITQNLEAFYLFEPTVVSIATLRINEEKMNKLELCIIQLGQALMGNNADKFTNNHHIFHQIIRSASNNDSIIQMLQKLEITYSLVSDMFEKCTPEDRNQIFAAHIHLFNAVKSKDPDFAYKHSQEMIITISTLLEKYENVVLPNIIKNKKEK